MAIHNRDQFLKNVATKYGRNLKTQPDTLPTWVNSYPTNRFSASVMSDQEAKNKFIDWAKVIGLKLSVATDENVAQVVNQIIASYQGGPVVLTDDARLHNLAITQTVQQNYESLIWNPSLGEQENIQFAAKANVGIVHAEKAVCETASHVLFASPQLGRSVSLLPKYSIVVMRASDFVRSIHDVATIVDAKAKQEGRLPSVVNVISGPSSTADIELVGVVGVHGPVGVTYVIINDDGSFTGLL